MSVTSFFFFFLFNLGKYLFFWVQIVFIYSGLPPEKKNEVLCQFFDLYMQDWFHLFFLLRSNENILLQNRTCCCFLPLKGEFDSWMWESVEGLGENEEEYPRCLNL